MKSFKHSIIIYTNHEVNSTIIHQIKLIINNIDKLNMKFIKASTYLSQFRFEIRHKFEKFNIISNALSRLFIAKKSKQEKNLSNNLNVDDESFLNTSKDSHYIEKKLLIQISFEFRKKLTQEYEKKKT